MDERKNIMYGDLLVRINNKSTEKKDCVWTEGVEYYKGNKILRVLSSKVVGKTNPLKSYTEVKASDEKRNNITGAYE